MSQLLVTSAPVIYIFLLLERKQQKWSLLKRADTVNGKTSCWVHCKLKHFVWGTGAPSHLQIPPWGYANETESYDMAYGGNLRGLFWYVCLDKNLKGKSCVFFLPKLNWVCNKLPLTEAVPRKKAGCYLEPKSSWFIQPGSFLETVFPSPLCPGERLQWAARPKDCGTGMLRKPLSSLAVGGLEETTDEDASSRTWVLFLTGHQKHLGIFFFSLLKSNMLVFFPVVSSNPFLALFVLVCAQGCWLLMVGFLGSLANWILHGGGIKPEMERQGASGVCFPCLPCLSSVSLLETEFLLSDHGPLGQLIFQRPIVPAILIPLHPSAQ